MSVGSASLAAGPASGSPGAAPGGENPVPGASGRCPAAGKAEKPLSVFPVPQTRYFPPLFPSSLLFGWTWWLLPSLSSLVFGCFLRLQVKGSKGKLKEKNKKRKSSQNGPKARAAPAAAGGSERHPLPGRLRSSGKLLMGEVVGLEGGAGQLPILYKMGKRLTCPGHVSA